MLSRLLLLVALNALFNSRASTVDVHSFSIIFNYTSSLSSIKQHSLLVSCKLVIQLALFSPFDHGRIVPCTVKASLRRECFVCGLKMLLLLNKCNNLHVVHCQDWVLAQGPGVLVEKLLDFIKLKVNVHQELLFVVFVGIEILKHRLDVATGQFLINFPSNSTH